MSTATTTLQVRIRLWIASGATLATLAIAAPAYAGPPPDPAGPGSRAVASAPVASCPTVSATATRLRAQGFAASAAKNFAVFIREDCLAG
jgi:hypothetical protein